jgi:hypothetical protein
MMKSFRDREVSPAAFLRELEPDSRPLGLVASRFLWCVIGAAIGFGVAVAIVLSTQ